MKWLSILLVVVLLLGVMPVQAGAQGRGGFMGFIAGCCFGIRAGLDYNDGSEIHWREWCRLIPYAGIIFALWDGVDGYQGKTRSDFVSQYGDSFF